MHTNKKSKHFINYTPVSEFPSSARDFSFSITNLKKVGEVIEALENTSDNIIKHSFIFDFYNSVDDIKNAFDDFHTSTSLSQPTDVNVLHDIKDALDNAAIYENDEVKEFNQLFFNKADA